jgi:hypothetical protein
MARAESNVILSIVLAKLYPGHAIIAVGLSMRPIPGIDTAPVLLWRLEVVDGGTRHCVALCHRGQTNECQCHGGGNTHNCRSSFEMS